MADEDLTVRARIDDELSGPLENIRDEVRHVGREAEDSARKAGRSSRGWDLYGRAAQRAGKLAHTAGRLAKGALIGIGAGTAALAYATGRLVRSSIGEAREAEKVGRTTAAIIKSTGGAAKITAKQVGDLAGRLSEKAGVDDELIQSGANLLLTFKQIRNEAGKGNRIFDRATAAALDLSAAGFGSVESGSKMLGKALNDPVKGMTALSRAGVTFTADQQATVKAMIEANDVLGAQKIILGEVESQVGGVAAAQATFGQKAAVVWGNMQERLGTALLPLLEKFSRWFVQDGAPALDHYLGLFERKGVPAIKRFVNRARELSEEYLPKVKDALADVRDVVGKGADGAERLVNAFLGMPSWARKVLVGGAVGGVAAKKLGVFGLLKGLGKGAGGLAALATKAKPLPVFVVNNGIPGTDGPGGKPRKPTGKLPPALATLGFAAAAGVGTDVTRRVLTDAIGAERTSAIQMSVATPGGTGIGAGALDVMDLDETAASRRKKKAAEQAAQLEKIARAADVARMKAAGFGAELDLVGARKITPELKADSITKANDYLARFIGMQIDAGRPITTYLTINGYAQAMQQISTLTTAIHSIPSAGVDNGVSYVGGGARPGPASSPSKPPKTTPNIVDRAPAGRVAGGNVTVAPGAIQVNNPASDIDLERAITNGVRNYVREREERR